MGCIQVSDICLYLGKLERGTGKFTAVADIGQKEQGILCQATKTFTAAIKRSFDCNTIVH